MRAQSHRVVGLGFALAALVGAAGCSSGSSSPAPSGSAGGNAQSGNGASNAGSAGVNANGGSAGTTTNGGSSGVGINGGGGNPNGGASGMVAMAGGGAGGAGGAGGLGGAGGAGGAVIDMSGPDSATGEAFNPQTGMLNVHYSEFMPKHDIVYNKPNTNPLYGLTVGNGHVGAMVWSANGLTMQVSNVDGSQQNAFAGGLVNLYTTPGMDTGVTTFQQRLALYDGTLTTQYDKDRTVTIMGSANSEVLGIHVEDSRANVTAISLDLSLWDVSTLGNSGNVPDINTWKTVTTYADATGAGISRGQTDANKFGYTLAATVSGAAFTTSTVNGSKVRLTITPGGSYTIWLACATRLNAPNNDSLTQAKAELTQAKAAAYADALAKYEDFWHSFWAKSAVQYSNTAGDADYLETAYYLYTYIIAAGGYGNYPFHFINGVFRATQDNTKWSNAYWFWNQRDVYNSFVASNHADVLSVFNNLYSRNSVALKAFTNTRFGIDGIWVPETMGWNGNADGNTQYTNDIFSTGTEAAENMYAQYAYTGDENYLKNTAYPFMSGVVKFYTAKLSKDANGKYFMAESNAHESYWGVQNAITDLAAVRSLFPVTIAVSSKLALDATLRPAWQAVLDNLVAYPTDGTNYLPYALPNNKQMMNDENVSSELIWPYSVTGIGAPDYAMALSTWKARPKPYDNVWANDAIQAARLGLGDEAMAGMKLMLQKYQNYPNGFTNNTNGVFEYMGVHLSVMNEALLQSYNDKIRVFPALPADASFVSRFTLAAKGGFLVTSEKEANDIKYVGIKSLLGNPADVINPWGTTAVQVRKLSDNSIALSSSAAELKFNTDQNGVYVIERTSKHLDTYTYAHLTGTASQDAQSLSANTFLGIKK
jgi:alpha-L-fucosidase 2